MVAAARLGEEAAATETAHCCVSCSLCATNRTERDMFCKPRGNAATRHLFVGNCGPAVGLTEAQVQQFFEGTGAQAVTIPALSEGASSHIFVTYQNAAEADAVLRALNDKPAAELSNRKLVIKFADRKSEHQADQVENKGRPASYTSPFPVCISKC